MARLFFIVFMTVFTVAVQAQAQTEKFTFIKPGTRHEVAIQLGAFRPTAGFGITGVTGEGGERFGGMGFLFAADYFHAVTSLLSAGLEGLYLNRGNYEMKNLPFSNQFAGASTQVRGNTMAILALLRLRAPGTGYRPFMIGGIGAHRTTMDVYMLSPPGTFWGAGFGPEMHVVQGKSTGPIGVLRGGIERAWADGGTLALEAGWVVIPAGTYNRTVLGTLMVPNDIVSRGDGLSISAKFGYRFGGGS